MTVAYQLREVTEPEGFYRSDGSPCTFNPAALRIQFRLAISLDQKSPINRVAALVPALAFPSSNSLPPPHPNFLVVSFIPFILFQLTLFCFAGYVKRFIAICFICCLSGLDHQTSTRTIKKSDLIL